MELIEFCRRIGINQTELAEQCGVSKAVVSQWNSGKRFPSYESIRKLLELGATVEELFGIDCRGSCPFLQFIRYSLLNE